MDLFELRRPDHLEDAAWTAIEVALERLRRAWDHNDLPDVIGKAKELVETVAKVVVAAVEDAPGDLADFTRTVKRAQDALSRVPGPNVTGDQNVSAIARAAQTFATRIGPIRNSYGTGHGRARVPDVTDEMATITLESALLWTRWALRRLGHVLADYPSDLIDAVNSATSLSTLQEKFDAAVLARQPPTMQLRVGVAFGQQASGGYGNARAVGVEPALRGDDHEFPVEYRVGLLKGMLLDAGGRIGLTVWQVQRFASLLQSLPDVRAKQLLPQMSEEVRDATWIETWRTSTVIDPHEVVAEIRECRSAVPEDYLDEYDHFVETLDEAARRTVPVPEGG